MSRVDSYFFPLLAGKDQSRIKDRKKGCHLPDSAVKAFAGSKSNFLSLSAGSKSNFLSFGQQIK
jgi:hypothetical protein